MPQNPQRLELIWIGKGEEPQLEPRILVEDTEKSYGDPNSENMLIHGDNLLALKALEQEYAGKVKCIYIDPPYNTGSTFEHYDDNLEHSIWLNLIKSRLNVLNKLLANDGFFCCHIDDSEGHYLKVLLDEVFGRSNYLTTFYMRVRYTDKTLKSDMDFHKEIEYAHVYRRQYGANPVKNRKDIGFEKYTFQIDELAKGKDMTFGGKKVTLFKKGEYKIRKVAGHSQGLKEIWATGTILDGNSSGRFFRDFLTGRYKVDGLGVLYKVQGIGDDQFNFRYFTGPKREGATKGKYFQGVPTKQLEDGITSADVPINNFYDFASNFGNCRHEGGVPFRSGKKPEAYLSLILKHFTSEGDLVLDSFLGSGTTAAVAHKMGRRWIGIELGEHANTHCLPRLKKVVDGLDEGGITKSVDWKGGGGFKFYNLAPSLLRQDDFGNWIIDERYNADMLAAAMAKQEGYRYAPNETRFWKQAKSTENDYLFTTTQLVTVELVERIAEQMEQDESLLICCKSFQKEAGERDPRIDVKKIPSTLLGRCEFGKDDYSLNIVNVPTEEASATFEPAAQKAEGEAREEKKRKYGEQARMFKPS